MNNIYDFTILASGEKDLREYEGQVLLIVNTASKCGFTPQYKGLQLLQDEFAERGFSVLAFPCNQFGKQEPGDNAEIVNFCEMNYQVSFPVFSKIDVNGEQAAIYKFMKNHAKGFGGEGIKWNFTKFLVDKTGDVVKRYAPTTKPEQIKKDIEEYLTALIFLYD